MALEILYFLVLILLLSNSLLHGQPIEVPLTLLFVLLIAILLREHNARLRSDFINQLKSQRRELRGGGTVAVDGLLLRYESELCSYVMSVGTLFSNITIKTPFRLSSGETQFEGLLCSIISLLTGWWSVVGPPSTIGAILNNFGGGDTISVKMLIDGPLHSEKN